MELFLHEKNFPEIVCVSETWLMEDEVNNFKLNGYNMAAHFSRRQLRCGGVCVFIRSDLSNFSSLSLEAVTTITEQDFEAAAVKVQVTNCKYIIVCCIYHSPCANYDVFCKSLEDLLVNLSKRNVHMFVCGDLNYDFNISNRKILSMVSRIL